MKDKTGKGNQISRRVMLPLLGGTLFLPFIGLGNNDDDESADPKDAEYQTLLKADGTTVKVKVGTLKKSKVVKKNVSNRSMFKWLSK